MENQRRVLSLRARDAVGIVGFQPTSSFTATRGAEMELHPAGVIVRYEGKHFVIPYGNILFAEIEGPQAKSAGPEGKGK